MNVFFDTFDEATYEARYRVPQSLMYCFIYDLVLTLKRLSTGAKYDAENDVILSCRVLATQTEE